MALQPPGTYYLGDAHSRARRVVVPTVGQEPGARVSRADGHPPPTRPGELRTHVPRFCPTLSVIERPAARAHIPDLFSRRPPARRGGRRCGSRGHASPVTRELPSGA